MSRKKKKEEEFMDFTVKSLVSASPMMSAVFYDPDAEDWCYFPVIAFTVGTLTVVKNGNAGEIVNGVIRGMISNHGGLESVEDNDELEFIGYWREDSQEFDDFLKDHGIDKVPGEGTAKPKDDDEEDE